MNGICNSSYINSIGLKTFEKAFFDKLELMLSENSSGKSGSFFFHTSDKKYMIKTIAKKEFEILHSTLDQYFGYQKDNPNTLLPRYFGLHNIKCFKNGKMLFNIYVMVQNNVFSSL